jgi:hypothetical protein
MHDVANTYHAATMPLIESALLGSARERKRAVDALAALELEDEMVRGALLAACYDRNQAVARAARAVLAVRRCA